MASNNTWGVSKSVLFDPSLVEQTETYPNLPTKLLDFLRTKGQNPLTTRYGKNDGPLSTLFERMYHCHLRDDAILLYRLKNRCIHLVMVVNHSDLEGKRAKKTVRRMANAGEMQEGLAARIVRDTMSALP